MANELVINRVACDLEVVTPMAVFVAIPRCLRGDTEGLALVIRAIHELVFCRHREKLRRCGMEHLYHILSHTMVHNLEEAKLLTSLDDLSGDLAAKDSIKEGTMMEVNEREWRVIKAKIIEEGGTLLWREDILVWHGGEGSNGIG
jgi:hypothetical protein